MTAIAQALYTCRLELGNDAEENVTVATAIQVSTFCMWASSKCTQNSCLASVNTSHHAVNGLEEPPAPVGNR